MDDFEVMQLNQLYQTQTDLRNMHNQQIEDNLRAAHDVYARQARTQRELEYEEDMYEDEDF